MNYSNYYREKYKAMHYELSDEDSSFEGYSNYVKNRKEEKTFLEKAKSIFKFKSYADVNDVSINVSCYREQK